MSASLHSTLFVGLAMRSPSEKGSLHYFNIFCK
jgi:hypothetical protein